MLDRLASVARYLIPPLIIAAGSMFFILRENQELAQFRADMAAEQESYVLDADVTRTETTQTVDALIQKLDYWQVPATQGDWHLLRRAHSFFQRRITQPLADIDEVPERLVDLNYFVRVSWKIRRFQDAEQGIEELLDLASTLSDTESDLLYYRITALNWKTCLLVNYRDPEAALQTASECVEICERLLNDQRPNQSTREVLSLLLRNAGIIEEVLGRDGIAYARRAADVIAASRPDDNAENDEQQMSAQTFLVDTLQMLGFLHLRHGRHAEAQDAWQQGLAECSKLVQMVEHMAQEETFGIPVLRIRKARLRLENDLAQLRRQTKDLHGIGPPGLIDSHGGIPESPAVQPQWAWTPLIPGDGLSYLTIDRLINATLPGEFESQEAMMLSWIGDNSWSHSTMLKLIQAIQETTPVVLLVADDEVREEAVEAITSAGIPFDHIEILTMATNTMWTRDFGPLTVRCDDGSIRVASSMFVDSFIDPSANNDFVPIAWSRATGWPMFRLPVMIESGALLSNGAGLCLASEFLLTKNDLSGIEEKRVTAALKRLTGADQIVYLKPLTEELTGHVDWFAAFTSADTVVIGDYFGLDEVNTKTLDENAGRLSGIMTRKGPLKVERIPMPPRGEKYFGGTYTNVVFANGNLLVPTWPEASPKQEEKALNVYRRLLPDWKIIPIDSYEFGRKAGSLHCATMNLYRYRPPKLLMEGDS